MSKDEILGTSTVLCVAFLIFIYSTNYYNNQKNAIITDVFVNVNGTWYNREIKIQDENLLKSTENLLNKSIIVDNFTFYFVDKCYNGSCGGWTTQDGRIWLLVGKNIRVIDLYYGCNHEVCHNFYNLDINEEETICTWEKKFSVCEKLVKIIIRMI